MVTRKKTRARKKKVGVKRIRVRPRARSIRRVVYGGALSDYIPSVETAASYVPGGTTALDYYNKGKKIYDTGKKLYNVYEQYSPVIDAVAGLASPGVPQPMPPPLPPVPKGGLPELTPAEKKYNAMLREKNKMREAMSKDDFDIGMRSSKKNPFLIPPPPGAVTQAQMDKMKETFAPSPFLKGTVLQDVINLGRKYKPVSFIDNTLNRFGVRDKVRGFLESKNLGALNRFADAAIQSGLGRRRVYRRRMVAKKDKKSRAIKRSAFVRMAGGRIASVSRVYI